MQFAYPSLFGLLVLAVIPFWWLYYGRRFMVFTSRAFSDSTDSSGTQKLSKSPILSGSKNASFGSKLFQSILISLIIVCLVIAMANPVRILSVQNPLKKGIDIVFVLDLSKSMLAEDIAPNRIRSGKEVIDSFIQARSNDRIGLVGFAGKPFVFSPLSFDTQTLTQTVNTIGVDSIKQEMPWLSGTAIGDALLLGTEVLADHPERSKVMILLTDGEANVGIDPYAATELVVNKHIVTHTIGIGSPTGTELYVTDSFGKRQYFLDQNGIPLKASIDEKLLKKIAADTGWTYANASSRSELDQALGKLDQLYKSELEVPPEQHRISYAWVLVMISLLISVIWLVREQWDITSPFRILTKKSIRLTKESTNFVTSSAIVFLKKWGILLGILLLLASIFFWRYQMITPGSITIVIDTSKSMLVRDVDPSRIELAKSIARKIVQSNSGKEISIVAFGWTSQTLSPRTFDTEQLLSSIDGVRVGNLPGGTDIKGTLEHISKAYQNGQSGIVYLISDGEEVTDLDESIPPSIGSNIKVQSIGVGTEEGGNIPLGADLFGKEQVKEVGGVPIVSKLSPGLLKQVSGNGGAYQQVEKISDFHLSGNSFSVSDMDFYANLAYSISALGAFLFLSALFLPYRKLEKNRSLKIS